MSQLLNRVGRVEAKVSAVSLWLARLLQSPEENENILNAASLLILKDVFDLPAPHLWKQLASRFEVENFKSWPDARTLFTAACQDLEGEHFGDDESKESLVFLARVYYDVFHVEAPEITDERERARREANLDRLFLAPLMARACPGLGTCSAETRRVWLQKMLDAPEEPESSLALLREYARELEGQKFR